MSEEERKKTTLAETEDVDREKQIVRYSLTPEQKDKATLQINDRIAELLKEQSPKSNIGNSDGRETLHPTSVGDQSVVLNGKRKKKIVDNKILATNLANF